MLKQTKKVLMLVLVFVGLSYTQNAVLLAVNKSTILDVDYRKLVSRADLTYDKPVSQSEHGLPIGNGTMGSLVWTLPTTLKFQINRVDVYANNRHTNSFPKRDSDYCGGCGFVDIDFVDFGEDVFPSERTLQRLSVYDGLVTVEGKGIKAQVLAWNEQDVMAIEISDQRDKPAIINTNLRMLRPAMDVTRSHTAKSKLDIRDGRIILTQEFTEDEYYCSSAVAISVIGRNAKAKLANETEVRLAAEPGKGSFTILIASAASFHREEDVITSAVNQLESAASRGYDRLVESNKRWWHDFWTKAFIHLHSADGVADYIEENYNYYLYVMASSSRGKLPPKFNAMLWTTRGDIRRWGSEHWWQNVSCLYRALPYTNRLELMDPMFDMYSNMYDACALAARQQWGSKGIFIPETVWFDGLEELPEDIAEEMRELYLLNKPWGEMSVKFHEYAEPKQTFDSRWNWKLHTGRWIKGRWTWRDKGVGPYGQVVHIFSTTARIAYLYWQRYECTLDMEWLRDRAYPMLKGSAEFYRNYPNVKKGADGKYHIYKTNNHESIIGIQDAMGEIAAMHGILPIVIRASEILNIDAEMRPIWREFLDNLAPLPTNDQPNVLHPREIGGPRLWSLGHKPVLAGHRVKRSAHTNVPCVYWDLCTLESDNPEMVSIDNASFESLFPNGVGPETRVGVFAKEPIAAAMLGRSADVKVLIPAQIRKERLHPNRLSPAEGGRWSHDAKGGVIDGGATIEPQGRASEALQLALCQSVPASPGEETVIRVFPAWPKEWDAEYTLLCRGGFLVTSSMQKGQIEFVEIQSQFGGECRLRNPWGNDEVTLYRGGREWKNMYGSLLKFNTREGENIVMVKRGSSPDKFKRVILGK